MRTSFGQAVISVTLLLMVVLLVLGASLQFLIRDFLHKENFNSLTLDADTIGNLAEAYYAEGALSTHSFMVNLSVAAQVSGADSLICNRSGVVLVCSNEPLGCRHIGMTIDKDYVNAVMTEGPQSGVGMVPGVFDEERYVVSVPVFSQDTGAPLGLVMASRPVGETLAVVERFTNVVFALSILVGVSGMLLVTFLAHRSSLPLKEMARVAGTFGHGDLTARVNLPASVPEEYQELALAFNNMASSLQKSEYARQQFVANVSHELKTPMTTIGGYVDGILDGTLPENKRESYLRIVSDEVKRLSRLVRSMLDISQLQNEQFPESKKTVFDAEEDCTRVLLTFEQKINAKKLDILVDMPEHPVLIRAVEDSIVQVVYNLIDNAIKFSPEGGKLGLRIQEGGGKAYISVSNEGETIPPEELPLVFDRFHKLDKSRSENRDGWGLGLYIVKTIVCSHGEDISVTSREGKTEFTFTMPLDSNLFLEAK